MYENKRELYYCFYFWVAVGVVYLVVFHEGRREEYPLDKFV